MPDEEIELKLQVFFDKGSSIEFPCNSSTKVKDVCDQICEERKLDKANFGLFVCHTEPKQVFERRLSSRECPYGIMRAAHERGQLRQLKFLFRFMEQARDASFVRNEDDTRCRGMSKSGLKRCGYLQKRGKHNTSWRLRWFVLKSGKLFYYKSHKHPRPTDSISIPDAVIRYDKKATNKEIKNQFQILTKDRCFYLKAETQDSMMDWVIVLKGQTVCESENSLIDQIQMWQDDVENLKADGVEQQVDSTRTLEGALRNQVMLSHFMKFVMEKHCDEELLFWVDAEDYQTRRRSEETRLRRALQIFDRFLKEGAPQPLAIDSATRQALKEKDRKSVV